MGAPKQGAKKLIEFGPASSPARGKLHLRLASPTNGEGYFQKVA
jgi:hypothetical protein